MIDLLIEIFSWILIVSGGIFSVIGAVGQLRFPDFWARLHAASVSDSAGMILLIAGMILQTGVSLITVKLIIIGEGEERKNLEKLISSLNLKNQVILKGRIDNASCLLKAFDIYVCSSVKEGLSYTIIEAMRAGLPIAATRVGGNSELIESQKNGILVKAGDSNALADAIQIFKNNQALSNKLGNNARQKALAEFGLKQMARKTKMIYDAQ